MNRSIVNQYFRQIVMHVTKKIMSYLLLIPVTNYCIDNVPWKQVIQLARFLLSNQ